MADQTWQKHNNNPIMGRVCNNKGWGGVIVIGLNLIGPGPQVPNLFFSVKLSTVKV